jgi:hypothetical protein
MKTLSLLLLGLMACSESLVPAAGPPGVSGPNGQTAGPSNGTGPVDEPDGDGYMPPPTSATFDLSEGQAVQLSGVVSQSGQAKGTIVLQILRVTRGNPPELLHSESLSQTGPFSLQAPSGLGAISLVAFMDVDDNGEPSEDDIGARSDLDIQSADLPELNLVLSDINLLGDLVPGRMLPPDGPEAADPEAQEPPTAPPAPPEVPAETE